jgi:uncharacterized membrane protein
MIRVSDSIVINAPRESVFEYVTDPAKMAEWMPYVMEVENIVGGGDGQQYEWTTKGLGILLYGEVVVVEHVPNELSVHQSIGAVHSTTTFHTEPAGAATRFMLEIVYEVPFPMLGKLAENVLARRGARAIANALIEVKELLEA